MEFDMSLPIHVIAYSGYKRNERPRQFILDDEIYEIAPVLDQWCEPSAMYFKVQSTEGKMYLLRYDEQTDEWTLESSFDGDELFARPSVKLITVEADVIRRAEADSKARLQRGAGSYHSTRLAPGSVDIQILTTLCPGGKERMRPPHGSRGSIPK
jgi:hypothetical protein